MNRASTERKDQYLYFVIAYITIIRLTDLNIEDYKALIYVKIFNKIFNEYYYLVTRCCKNE